MQWHADSQITDAKAARLMLAALHDPGCRDSLRIERAMAIGSRDVLERTSLDTPEGLLHRVAVVRVLDGEQQGFDAAYRDEVDAVAVWDHLAAEARAQWSEA